VLVRELCAIMHHEDGSRGLRGLFLAIDDSVVAPEQAMSHDAFAAFVAHELSQPVGAVLANVSAIQRMLRSSPPMLGDALEALDDVAISARRVTALIDWIRSAH
jgi:signal transduction histidine kinase